MYVFNLIQFTILCIAPILYIVTFSLCMREKVKKGLRCELCPLDIVGFGVRYCLKGFNVRDSDIL